MTACHIVSAKKILHEGSGRATSYNVGLHVYIMVLITKVGSGMRSYLPYTVGWV